MITCCEEKITNPNNGGGSVLSRTRINTQSLRLETFSSFDFKRGMIHFSTALTIGSSDPSLHSVTMDFPEMDTYSQLEDLKFRNAA